MSQRSLPPWLIRRRVCECVDLDDEMAVARRRHRELMDRKVSEVLGMGEAEPEAWQEIRRGWYFGTDRFRDRLLDHAAQAVKGRRRTS